VNRAALTLDEHAVLPASYLAARMALSTCERIDACKAWSDKAAAIASYAAQAKDEELLATAQRIRARAVRRLGELLEQIPPNGGGRHCETRPSRKAAAEAAGLSRVQRNQAAALAHIPAVKFESLVERPKPPKVYQLAELGRQPRRGGRPAGSTRENMLLRDLSEYEERARIHAARLAGALGLVRQAKAALANYRHGELPGA
jgi:hypothetical protein